MTSQTLSTAGRRCKITEPARSRWSEEILVFISYRIARGSVADCTQKCRLANVLLPIEVGEPGSRPPVYVRFFEPHLSLALEMGSCPAGATVEKSGVGRPLIHSGQRGRGVAIGSENRPQGVTIASDFTASSGNESASVARWFCDVNERMRRIGVDEDRWTSLLKALDR